MGDMNFPASPEIGEDFLGWSWDGEKWVHNGLTGLGGGGYDDTQIKADLAQETQDRIEGDANLQGQINNLSGGGGGNDPRITDTQIVNWDASFSWGDHKGLYLEAETDPTVPQYVKNITEADINKWNSGTGGGGDVDLTGYATEAWVSSNYQPKGSYAASNHNHSGVYQPAGSYASASHTHPYVPTSGNTTISGTLTATDFVATSDRNKKDNIETAKTGFMEHIRGVTFNWKDTGSQASGVVAQELQEAGLGHLVHEDEDGLKVSYNGLTAYLIEEVKALRAEIEAMKR